ncbi:hypothetical protein STCU_03445 [Strigomonas culicis]|uniref:Uncharacterized protein n=1 Tax=Strigomonas culicis TaxID=28005 RepID=S9URM6_9TRYP|nr:hypothetical protein STCU_03445 [Strigomonas culicis]|eukprot:EPY31459.1 hypothetical protein STCU_03445 [Strigomonas culicis]
MGLALCHSIPRDIFAYVALLLLFIGFILQIGIIARHDSATGAGYITRAGGGASEAVAYVAVHPALYGVRSVSASGSTAAISVVDRAAKLCNPSTAELSFHCARFAEAYHTVNGVTLASFISSVLAFFFGMFVSGRCSHKTSDILGRLALALAIPTALQCALLGLFYVRIVGNAKKVVLVDGGLDTTTASLVFHRGYATDLAIASTALFSAASLLLTVRWGIVVCTRMRLKRSARSNPSDAERMKSMHLVNDDWQRQMQVLRSHARSVHVEMLIREDAEEEAEAQERHHEHHAHDVPNSEDDVFGVTFRQKRAAEEAAASAVAANRKKAEAAATAQQEQYQQLLLPLTTERDYTPVSHAEPCDHSGAAKAAARPPKETHDPHEL